MKQMLKAKESIDFAMFTFAQSSGIDDTMLRLVGPLERVRGVLDRVQGAAKWVATENLKAAGVKLFQNKPGTGVRKVHHKLMVIDQRLVIAGSSTTPSRRPSSTTRTSWSSATWKRPTPPLRQPSASWPPSPSPRSSGLSLTCPSRCDVTPTTSSGFGRSCLSLRSVTERCAGA